MSTQRRHLAVAALAMVSLAGAAASPLQPEGQPAAAQEPAPQGQPPRGRSLVPDTFTNLQVLPKDISKPELVGIMKGFSLTFDKRCSYCHVATDDLSEADFAADDKETKKKARELLRMIRETQKTPAAP